MSERERREWLPMGLRGYGKLKHKLEVVRVSYEFV